MVTDEVFVELVASVIVASRHAVHNARLFEVGEVAVNRALCEPRPVAEELGHRGRVTDVEERVDQPPPTVRINESSRAQSPSDLGVDALVGRRHRDERTRDRIGVVRSPSVNPMNDASSPRVLVTGATGYVGGRLVPLLVDEGFGVRVLVRSAAKVRNTAWIGRVEVVEGDALDQSALDRALAGVDVAFYLLHSISTGAKFDDLEASMARRFADAASRAGVGRIVYLGGIANDERLSKHLASRRSVGQVLASTGVPVIELRAGIIIGSGSASFEMLRYLTEHLPAMVTPRWVDNPTQPIAIVNMLHFLVAAARAPKEVRGVFDVGGAETLTYREMMTRYARVAGLRRRIIIRVPLLTPRVSSMWVGLVTPVPASIARPLIDSLINKVVVDPKKSVLAVLPPPPEGLLTFDQAVKRAIERTNAPTRWTDASRPWVAWDVAVTDPAWTGGTLFVDEREQDTTATRDQVWHVLSSLGGTTGWYGFEWLWRLRGRIDSVFGGVGMRRGRRDQNVLRVGDPLDFWRIAEVKDRETLLLRAEMRVPGQAWLEFKLTDAPRGTHVVQRAIFRPRGLAGRLYWWVLIPFHAVIFPGMLRNALAHAEKTRPDEVPRLPQS